MAFISMDNISFLFLFFIHSEKQKNFQFKIFKFKK